MYAINYKYQTWIVASLWRWTHGFSCN